MFLTDQSPYLKLNIGCKKMKSKKIPFEVKLIKKIINGQSMDLYLKLLKWINLDIMWVLCTRKKNLNAMINTNNQRYCHYFNNYE
jgi:hypothetical protein